MVVQSLYVGNTASRMAQGFYARSVTPKPIPRILVLQLWQIRKNSRRIITVILIYGISVQGAVFMVAPITGHSMRTIIVPSTKGMMRNFRTIRIQGAFSTVDAVFIYL
jgi:hypothetical protein